MRLSDWSSDVCSSDLEDDGVVIPDHRDQQPLGVIGVRRAHRLHAADMSHDAFARLAVRLTAEDASPTGGPHCHWEDRKSAVWGKSVSARLAMGGRRTNKKKKRHN